jgi:uncharacterized membrane protein
MRRRPPTGLDPADAARWRATLVAGLVVAVVVWGLLEALRRAAVAVDTAVADLWTAGKRLAQNTQAAHLLTGTRDGGAALLEELEHHRHPTGEPKR